MATAVSTKASEAFATLQSEALQIATSVDSLLKLADGKDVATDGAFISKIGINADSDTGTGQPSQAALQRAEAVKSLRKTIEAGKIDAAVS